MRIVNGELIKKWEKLRLTAYLPTPNDVWTIGWGHTRTASQGMHITEVRAQELFTQDVAWVEAAIAKHVKVPLNQNQYDALASLVFNIGETQFRTSTLLRKLNAQDYKGAADQFLVWNKQRGETLNGLVKRRKEERTYFLSPLVPTSEAVGGAVAAIVGVGATLVPLDTDWPVWPFSVALVVAGIVMLASYLYKKGNSGNDNA